MGAKTKVPVVVVLIILGLFQFLTGLILYLSPHGRHTGKELVLGIPKGDWSYYHTWVGFALVCIVVLHLALNWKYFMGELRVLRR